MIKKSERAASPLIFNCEKAQFTHPDEKYIKRADKMPWAVRGGRKKPVWVCFMMFYARKERAGGRVCASV